jgi:hypothetical protein
LGDLIDAYNEITKRRVIFQTGQRCGDSLEDGQEKLEANGQAIVSKFLTSGASKDIREYLTSSSAEGGEQVKKWKECQGGIPEGLNLNEASAFDGLADVIVQSFEVIVATKCQ